MNYEVSDGLSELRASLADYESSGCVMNGDGVTALRLRLKQLCEAAKALEHEVSRHRWNEISRREQAHRGRLVAQEAAKPLTNLVVLASRRSPQGHNLPGGDAA